MIGSFDEQEALVGCGVDEERWLSLSAEAKVALAIAGLDMEQESFEEASNITEALVAATELDEETIRKANRLLLGKELLDRSGFLTGDALKLSLNEDGYKFLEEELAKVQ
jgi:hypothetical protein